MKKHLHNSLRALFLSLAVLLSLPMLAVEVEIDGIRYNLNAEAKQATVIAKSSGYYYVYSGEVVIPESVEYKGVTHSVTSIGKEAFRDCSGLTSVTIPNSVTSIGDYAFDGCSGLTSLTIPNSVTSIGHYAFWGCTGLTSVTIPNSVTSIGGSAFLGCSGLTSVTIGNSVTSIGGWAFDECTGLTSVTIPNSVTSIGVAAFRGCDGLTSIVVEEGNPVYDSRNNCNAIVETASNSLICGCNTSIIPNSVTSIRSNAFEGCSGLTSVTIPNRVTSIGYLAFRDCSKLHDVYCYAENVPSTDNNAFSDSNYKSATLHVPAASINSYKATAPWSSFGNIVALPNYFNLTVSSAGYATLYLDFNAEIPAGVQAYTGVKVVGNRLKMERVEGVLPANTGVIIKAEEGMYTFAESDATPATIGDNLLYGTVATTQISTDPTYSYYVLSKVDGIVGMYLAKLTDGKFQNNANKAYMMLKKGDLGIYDEGVDTGTEQLSRGFVFDFGEETSIDELKSENGKVKSAVYDLSGRRVQKAQKGIYIQNGKVVLVR